MRKKNKIIQVPMPDDLLRRLDHLSRERDESRSAIIREACARYIADKEEAELDRRYVQAYTDQPETEEEMAWGALGLKMLAEATADDDWSEEWNDGTE